MTWAGAIPVLAIAGLFDAVRMFFEQFWFFGPAAIGAYCTNKASGYVGMLWGLTPAACGTGATALGYFGSPVFTTIGFVMAFAVGLLGWLTVGALLMATNSRIFKENGLWFAASLLISEIPIIGTIPALSVMVWRMYRTQIKKEAAVLKKYKKEQAAAQAEDRAARLAEFSAQRQAEETHNKLPLAAYPPRTSDIL